MSEALPNRSHDSGAISAYFAELVAAGVVRGSTNAKRHLLPIYTYVQHKRYHFTPVQNGTSWRSLV